MILKAPALLIFKTVFESTSSVSFQRGGAAWGIRQLARGYMGGECSGIRVPVPRSRCRASIGHLVGSKKRDQEQESPFVAERLSV